MSLVLRILILGLCASSLADTSNVVTESARGTYGNISKGQTNSWVKDIFINLDPFTLIFVPAILLTFVYVLFVAANSPHNEASHYLVDFPGKPHELKRVGRPHKNRIISKGKGKLKRIINSLTTRVMDSLEKEH